MTLRRWVLSGTAALAILFTTFNVFATQRVDDFVLLDQHGVAHQMHYHKDAPAVVLIVHGNGCQIVQSNLEDYRALRDDYADEGVKIMMINSNLQDTRESIGIEATEWQGGFPILGDSTQAKSRSLGLARTAGGLRLNPLGWSIVYRGAPGERVPHERPQK